MAKIGLEARVLLVDPEGNEWQYRLSFGFQTVAVSSPAWSERAYYSYRFLLNDEYEVKESRLKKYHSIATQLLARFDKVQVKQVPRSDNTRADALSKLESSIVIEQRGRIML
ncbi:Integrase, catalytic core [Gossypium australe]|uniref:Integrase, catalytic core n=1 Tax=Gossypium australe TaxID=47621 RepID=A0A5B6WV86_9ROSI|nr:Integrase, catalytic core [Gossypium australe]